MLKTKERKIIFIVLIAVISAVVIGLSIWLTSDKSDATLDSIYIKKLPVKTEYYEGEYLDLSGLIVAATYGAGEIEKEIPNYNVSIDRPLTAADTSVTIMFTENRITKSCSFLIRVTPTVLTGILIESLPYKLQYKTGQVLDTAGLQIRAVFNDGSYMRSVTDWTTNVGDRFLSIDDTIVEVNYKHKEITQSTRFTIEIEHRTIESMQIVRLPEKTNYVEGDYFDLYGMQLKVFCKDSLAFEPSGVEIVNGRKPLTIGDDKVIINFEENGVVVNVQIDIHVTPALPIDTQVEKVINLIALLPQVSDLVLTDRQAVAYARSAYESLDTQQRMSVDTTVLEELETRLAVLISEAENRKYNIQYRTSQSPLFDFSQNTNPTMYKNGMGQIPLVPPESEEGKKLGYEFKYWVYADSYERVSVIENITFDTAYIAVYDLTDTLRLQVKDAQTNEIIVNDYVVARLQEDGHFRYDVSSDDNLKTIIQDKTDKMVVCYVGDIISTNLFSVIDVYVVLSGSGLVRVAVQNQVIVSYEYQNRNYSMAQENEYKIPLGAVVTLQVVNAGINAITVNDSEIVLNSETKLASFELTEDCSIKFGYETQKDENKTIAFVLDDYVKVYHFKEDWNGKLTSGILSEIATMFDETNIGFLNYYDINGIRYFFSDLSNIVFTQDSVITVVRAMNRFKLKINYSGGELVLGGLIGKQTLRQALDRYILSHPDEKSIIEELPSLEMQKILRADITIRLPDRTAFTVNLFDEERLIKAVNVPSENQSLQYQLDENLLHPKKLGYVFEGWAYEKNGNVLSSLYLNTILQNKNVNTDLYAIWSLDPNCQLPPDHADYDENFVGKWYAAFTRMHHIFDASLELNRDGTYRYVIYVDGAVNAELFGEYRCQNGGIVIYSVVLSNDYQVISRDRFNIDIRFCDDNLLVASCFYITKSSGEISIAEFDIVLNDENIMIANYYGCAFLGEYVSTGGTIFDTITLAENGTAFVRRAGSMQVVLYRADKDRIVLLSNGIGVTDITDDIKKIV